MERHEFGDLKTLARAVEQRVSEEAEVEIAVEALDDRLVLNGILRSEGEQQAVLDIAEQMVGAVPIDNQLDIEQSELDVEAMPADIEGPDLDRPDTTLESSEDVIDDVEPDFTDQPLIVDSIVATEGTEDEVYFPPTDPPVGQGYENSRPVIEGTFEPTSLSSMSVERSSDGTLGDEAIADAVRRQLARDAATSGIDVDVEVQRGVARIRGVVQDVDDLQSVEAVVEEVSGVEYVINELNLAGDAGSQS